MPGIRATQTIQGLPQVGRKTRRPQHSFQVRQVPWAIQPFMIAPVLPGDTMKNLLLQARVVSDPVKHPLIGWWNEFYFFYVQHRALAGSAQFQAMMLDPTATAGNTVGSGDPTFYKYAGGVNYVGQCYDAVVKHFFRDEGEALGAKMLNGMYAARIGREDWMDSLMRKTDFDAANKVPDVEVEGADANTTIQASEIEKAMRQYNFLRQNNLTEQTYEDFLRTYGVSVPEQEKEHLPELLRYTREWTYPSNTVNPADGKPTSALSWSITERADKDRFFREPGFIFGVTVTRPKVYLSLQTGAAVGLLDNVFAWLPAVLGDDPYTSLKHVPQGQGPLPSLTDANGYVVDLKDLYLYGDQFLGGAMGSADATGYIALPEGNGSKRYANEADITALFTGGADASPKKYIRADGVVALNILSRVVDTTANT